MGNYLKIGFTLMAFSIVVALLLATVYTITADPIALAELNVKLESIKTVLTDPINGTLLIEESDIPQSQEKLNEKIWKKVDSDNLYESSRYNGYCSSPAYKFTLKDGREAYIFNGASVGYGGYVSIMCSFVEQEGSLQMLRLEVLDYSQETPGLGAKIAEEAVKERFFNIPQSGLTAGVIVDKDSGKSPAKTAAEEKNNKKEGIISVSDLMTGATITPRGVANAINTMVEYLEQTIGGDE
ncbi:MAG TPA: RnfABCDGE type electron transport complex subunit G [Thermotogota bacterium]|nr:RnfABCDGE type electron transport complex subunit G [Thermotogota bacterium]HRW34213.1 RnfABCDGE type electron transport complex subunit G [Thermotogota bacterium]